VTAVTAPGGGPRLRAGADDIPFPFFFTRERVGVAVTAVTAVTQAFAAMSVARLACATRSSGFRRRPPLVRHPRSNVTSFAGPFGELDDDASLGERRPHPPKLRR
jgi:hypothetical protein